MPLTPTTAIADREEGLRVIVKHNPINKKMYFFSNASFILDFTVDPYCNKDTIDVSN